jgi:hypothetical protein
MNQYISPEDAACMLLASWPKAALQASSKVGLELLVARAGVVIKLGALNISNSYIRKVCSHDHTYIVIYRTKSVLPSIYRAFVF